MPKRSSHSTPTKVNRLRVIVIAEKPSSINPHDLTKSQNEYMSEDRISVLFIRKGIQN